MASAVGHGGVRVVGGGAAEAQGVRAQGRSAGYAVAVLVRMRIDLFDQVVESVREMKAIQSDTRRSSRVTRVEELLRL